MKDLFYLLSIFPLVFEMKTIMSPNIAYKIIKDAKGKKWDDYSTTMKAIGVFGLFYLSWTFIGLLSFQWPLFLTLIILSMLPKPAAFLRWLDAFHFIIIR